MKRILAPAPKIIECVHINLFKISPGASKRILPVYRWQEVREEVGSMLCMDGKKQRRAPEQEQGSTQ